MKDVKFHWCIRRQCRAWNPGVRPLLWTERMSKTVLLLWKESTRGMLSFIITNNTCLGSFPEWAHIFAGVVIFNLSPPSPIVQRMHASETYWRMGLIFLGRPKSCWVFVCLFKTNHQKKHNFLINWHMATLVESLPYGPGLLSLAELTGTEIIYCFLNMLIYYSYIPPFLQCVLSAVDASLLLSWLLLRPWRQK